MRDQFALLIDEPLHWKLLPETQKIDQLQCQKAEVEYGGRHWIAWYTTEVPSVDGPYVFHGLPGLIVQITDQDENYAFNLVHIKNTKENNLYPLNKYNAMTWTAFKKFVQNYYSDPFSYIKASNLKAMQSDGNGGSKPMDFKGQTHNIQKAMESIIPIELHYSYDLK